MKQPESMFSRTLSESFIKPDGTILIRGSKEWDHRELERLQAGCAITSFGPLPDSDIYSGIRYLPCV